MQKPVSTPIYPGTGKPESKLMMVSDDAIGKAEF
jgi:hypothetical protein